MLANNVTIFRSNGSARTSDFYEWPVSTLTFTSLLESRYIERSPQSNSIDEYRLTQAGEKAARNKFQKLVFTQKKENRNGQR